MAIATVSLSSAASPAISRRLCTQGDARRLSCMAASGTATSRAGKTRSQDTVGILARQARGEQGTRRARVRLPEGSGLGRLDTMGMRGASRPGVASPPDRVPRAAAAEVVRLGGRSYRDRQRGPCGRSVHQSVRSRREPQALRTRRANFRRSAKTCWNSGGRNACRTCHTIVDTTCASEGDAGGPSPRSKRRASPRPPRELKSCQMVIGIVPWNRLIQRRTG
jgi:hypothetical protein